VPLDTDVPIALGAAPWAGLPLQASGGRAARGKIGLTFACTVLEGPLPDQAALIGVLKGLYDLGLPLLLVECVEDNGEGAGGAIG
jgi:hypothetical protein